MVEGGFFERRKLNPAGLTAVILLHGAVLTAVALAKNEVPFVKVFTPIKVTDYQEPPEPEPLPEPQPEVRPKTQIDAVKPIVQPPLRNDPIYVEKPLENVVIFDPGPIGKDYGKPADPPRPADLHPPVRKEAQMSASSELQPPYPASEERAGTEGKVAVRVTIGVNGRVVAVEKVSATNDAFYRATERHALRGWRFKPATLDGKPIESTRVITVTFRLNA